MHHVKYRTALLLITAILFAGCTNKDNHSISKAEMDSCATAVKFKNAVTNTKTNFSGEMCNYWGDDTTKLDFKHIYKDGQLVKSIFYFEDQTVEEEYNYKCESLHGTQKWYYNNGQLAKTIAYSYGRKQGSGKLFNQQGKLIQEVEFINDSLIKQLTYDSTGIY